MATTDDEKAVGGSLLAPNVDDDDTSSIRSVSMQDSDSADDEVLQGARTSREIASHDRTVLEEEDEREKLLVRQGSNAGLRRIFSGGHDDGSRVRIGKGKGDRSSRSRSRRREARRERRRRKKARLLSGHGEGEQQELMQEMEEGGLKSDASSVSSDGSSDFDRRNLGSTSTRKARGLRCCKYSLIYAAIVTLFLILLLGAYQASRDFRAHNAVQILSNGTASFAPTTILLSLDGFRADFLDRGLTPTLNDFIADGVSPRYMLPSFPSVTFPNHFTLVTGLHPESHGIVGNTFWDPTTREEFYYTDPARSMQPKWWQAEPLWVTAENAGVRSAIHMWPGSEAHIAGVEPAYLDKYNGTEVLSRKVERVLDFLDMPQQASASLEAQRPQFIAAYVPVVDADGHKFGPNSTEIRSTIKRVDDMLHDLFEGIKARNLTDVVNVVIVSDHGMATTSTSRLIQFEDLIDPETIEHTDGWPLYGLRPKNEDNLTAIYDHLSAQAATNPHFEVYLRDVNMPERYHFKDNPRIAPLWIVPEAGWAIVTREELDLEKAKQDSAIIYHPRGLHGYDHEHPLMRAIFVARGPAFPHTPNSRVAVFQNTEVYNIICDSLSLTPRPNNGTLRLPLKPVGLHSDPDASPAASPSDFPPDTPPPSPSGSGAVAVDPPDDDRTRPVVEDGTAQTDEQKEDAEVNEFWQFFSGKFDKFREWVNGLVSGTAEEKEVP